MERKIGEIFEFDGEWYQCVPNKECNECSFHGDEDKCCMTECSIIDRSDSTSVVFKKLEKVGEPYVSNNRTFQLYKLAMPIYGDIPDQITGFTTTEVVIKQNKEDMEEKNLKPFDLQKAREGKPVCTRDGRKARIICFDVKGNFPMAVAVELEEDIEVIYTYPLNGRANPKGNQNNGLDLMMLPEKKEGWVNIDKGGSGKITISSPYSTKEEAIHNDNETTIDTIKIYWEE